MWRLIVADDEPIIRNGLISGVDWESLGFMVTASFSCGSDIIEYLKNNPADVLLSDIVMNRGTGLDAAEWIEENRPGMSVVLFTGYSDFAAASRAVSLKCIKYLLSKPTQLPDLYSVFSKIADSLRADASARSGDNTAQLIQDLFLILEGGGASGELREHDFFVAANFPNLDAADLNVPEFTVNGRQIYGFPVRIAGHTLAIWHCQEDETASVAEYARLWAELSHAGKACEIDTFRGLGGMLSRYAAIRGVPAAAGREHGLMDTVNQYLNDHLSEGLQLQDVAKSLYFSPGYLSRLIKENTGLNFSEYVLRYKIDRAREYLSSTPMKIQDVGARVGYVDMRHFARMFKRVTGSTPSQYRRGTRGLSDGKDS